MNIVQITGYKSLTAGNSDRMNRIYEHVFCWSPALEYISVVVKPISSVRQFQPLWKLKELVKHNVYKWHFTVASLIQVVSAERDFEIVKNNTDITHEIF